MEPTMSNAAKEVKAGYQRSYRTKMSNEARQKATEYMRSWRLKNPEKLRQYNINYWERKANAPEAIEDRIVNLHYQGKSLREIGLILGLSHMKIKRILDNVT
jgi:DNA-directed RNA polymerase specialized sigma subunit